ncbi:MAG: PAS domain S-box protein [Deltaproteobacteria bacterium]|nr:PAS domain S-box protein [Deltaproteobacteria bacterium]
MSIYLVLPLLACIFTAILTTIICCRGSRDRSNRDAALLLGGFSFWAACEVLSNTRSDPDSALAFIKASTLGWAFIGPLGVGLALAVSGEDTPRVRRAQPVLFAAGALFLLLDWFTPWFHTSVSPTRWGWGYELGPAFALFHLYALACMWLVFTIVRRAYREMSIERERSYLRWIGGGLLGSLVLAGLTDSLLPMFDIQVPHIGTLVHASWGGALAWTFYRSGYPLLAPGLFAGEILETLPDGVAMLRLDGRIRYGNSAMAKLLGRSPSHLDGLNVRDLIHALRDRLIGELTEVECELRSRDGDSILVSVSTATLSDRHGSPIGIVLVARDLRELESLRSSLLVSGRLAAVGELAAGIAHEINNPLAYVRANLSLLRQHWESLGIELEKSGVPSTFDELIAEGAEMIDESLEGVDRASAIVRDVKGLAHAGRGERSMADLNELLDSVLRMAAPQLKVTAVVEKEYGLLPLIACAPQELQQVFLNLVLNASQAIVNRGTIQVRTEAQDRSVMVWIEDDGCGVEPDMLDRIFDPFFTTKPVGEGTGLGLGIAHQIVRKHGGEITIESKSGRGSVFAVRLPVRVDTLTGELN